jgi:hypothetical protein
MRDDLRAIRLVGTALRCYPARWRRRHGDEAAELAALLIRDGVAPGSIALSYLAGAAREWLVPRASQRLSMVAAALLVVACSVGLSAGLLASALPARAASTGSTGSAASTGNASSTSSPGSAGGMSRVNAHVRCRPGSLGTGPYITPATGHPPATIWEAGHGRAC